MKTRSSVSQKIRILWLSSAIGTTHTADCIGADTLINTVYQLIWHGFDLLMGFIWVVASAWHDTSVERGLHGKNHESKVAQYHRNICISAMAKWDLNEKNWNQILIQQVYNEVQCCYYFPGLTQYTTWSSWKIFTLSWKWGKSVTELTDNHPLWITLIYIIN